MKGHTMNFSSNSVIFKSFLLPTSPCARPDGSSRHPLASFAVRSVILWQSLPPPLYSIYTASRPVPRESHFFVLPSGCRLFCPLCGTLFPHPSVAHFSVQIPLLRTSITVLLPFQMMPSSPTLSCSFCNFLQTFFILWISAFCNRYTPIRMPHSTYLFCSTLCFLALSCH